MHQKLVLLGISRRLKKADEVSSGDAGKLYELVCEETGMKAMGYTTFWETHEAPGSEGLIVRRTSNSNREGAHPIHPRAQYCSSRSRS